MQIEFFHERIMQVALQQAHKADEYGEVPVGAVIVKNNKIIARGFNQCITKDDATAHAEIMAIRKACKKLNNYRLVDCDIYVTLEPCIMCIGAIINARFKNLFFAALDPKIGASALIYSKGLNHKINLQHGILRDESSAIIKNFFRKKRL